MTKTLKLACAAAMLAASSTTVFAQDVPLNTTVSGGTGSEQVAGQAEGALGIAVGAGVAAALTIAVVIAAADGSTATTTVAQ